MSVHTDAQTLVERTTTAQEIPQHVEDPAVIGRVARLLSSTPAHHEGAGHG